MCQWLQNWFRPFTARRWNPSRCDVADSIERTVEGHEDEHFNAILGDPFKDDLISEVQDELNEIERRGVTWSYFKECASAEDKEAIKGIIRKLRSEE